MIISGQQYIRITDEDMSDYTLGFYEIIYQDLLTKPILNENGCFHCGDFAGDTMNTFNTVANIASGAGKSKRHRTPMGEWPSFLIDFYNVYNCLANFWILPKKIGRCSKKRNYYDSMDIFLTVLKENYEDYRFEFPIYFSKMPSYEYFIKKHFLGGIDKIPTQEIKKMYQGKEANTIINIMTRNIYRRAKNISESSYADALYQYFTDTLSIKPRLFKVNN